MTAPVAEIARDVLGSERLTDALDYASVVVFALTGALVASRSQLDIVGFIFVACLTAVGGGTIRDILLDRPVFWIATPALLLAAALAATLVFFTAHLLESRFRALLWLDACALAVAVPAGVGVAFGLGLGWPLILVSGMITGCFGGLMRDVVCNEVPLVLRQGELYVTAALAGAVGAVAVVSLSGSETVALAVCALATFFLRAGSLAFGWSLPVYRSRPPKPDSPKR